MKNIRSVKFISWLLGVTFFVSGTAKFVDPFKTLYTLQIAFSELPNIAYTLGLVGEMATGTLLILALIYRKNIAIPVFRRIIFMAGTLIVIMMLTACYVHIHPAVPAEVLPLMIKPPLIPGFLIVLALADISLARRTS